MDNRQTTSLVTGGSGFVGSYICEYLLAVGHKVICVDNLVTGSQSNISHLLNHSDFIFVSHDIIQPVYLDEMLKDKIHGVDFVYNFAGLSDLDEGLDSPLEAAQLNVLGNVLPGLNELKRV